MNISLNNYKTNLYKLFQNNNIDELTIEKINIFLESFESIFAKKEDFYKKRIENLENKIIEISDYTKYLYKEKEEIKLQIIASENNSIKLNNERIENIQRGMFTENISKSKSQLLDLINFYIEKNEILELKQKELENHVYNLSNEIYLKNAEITDLKTNSILHGEVNNKNLMEEIINNTNEISQLKIKLLENNKNFEQKNTLMDLKHLEGQSGFELKNKSADNNLNVGIDNNFSKLNCLSSKNLFEKVTNFTESILKLLFVNRNLIKKLKFYYNKNIEELVEKSVNEQILEKEKEDLQSKIKLYILKIEKQELLISKLRKVKLMYDELKKSK